MGMKKLVMIAPMMLFIAACEVNNDYKIVVTTENAPDSVMVHNNWYETNDTIPLVDGTCTFAGVCDTFPKLTSLGFPYPLQVRTRMILEPGTITAHYSPETGFRLGGTKNNIILQEMFDTMKPLEAEVSRTWKAWSKAYNSEPRIKDSCETAWTIDQASKQRLKETTLKLIDANPNYAGLAISLPLVRTETAETLKKWVDHFSRFGEDARYQGIVTAWEVADRTTNGKPVPEFTFPDTTGAMVSLSDFRGKWVLLDFWYVDCPWCRKLTPHLINIYRDWKETRDFEIISISVDKPKDYDRWKEAIVHDGAPWTQVLDSTKTYPLEYGITGYPTLILIDPEGNGVRKIVGYQEEGGMRRILEEYIMKEEREIRK